MPKANPHSVTASSVGRGRPPTRPPMRQAAENSEAVLPSIERK